MRLFPLLLHLQLRRSTTRKRKRRIRRRSSPMDKITDDLLIEILARVPYKSLRRFTCVSRRWRALIADPDNFLKLPQTLAGFFYRPADSRLANYESVTGPPFFDPSLAFLPNREREGLHLLDGCNGLLLCRCYRFADPNEFDYLVINPATEKWVAVPGTRRWSNAVRTVRLGFQPAVSSHFHVFEFQLEWDEHSDSDSDSEDDEDGYVSGVKIYSSETGLWIYKQSNWSVEVTLNPSFNSVFDCGVLYVVTLCCLIGAVDVEGRTWRIIDFPRNEDSPFYDTGDGFIDLSQGKLHLANNDDFTGDGLAIWVLEDPNSEEWTLKHMVSFTRLRRKRNALFVFHKFIVVAIHPDRNMVFFVAGRHKRLMSCDMDSGEVCVISDLGQNFYEHFIPYVPLFSGPLPELQ